ncbi:MAG TPA: SDR family oxidoreductase [Dehalococcoidia bacterium]|nr:SDR family oxidoreductase [Dehalococcoidia bacterium]
MDFGLTGRVAIVGGSSQGIGKAIAATLAAEGCDVAISARHTDALEATANEIREASGRSVLSQVCDMARPDDIQRLVVATAERFGRIDIIVNNAGGPPTGLFTDHDEMTWRQAIDQNLMSVVRLTRDALPHLKRSGNGRIINITSVAVKEPMDRLILSNTARLGVVGLAKTLSRELGADGITVNNICPGKIATARRMALMEERAAMEHRPFEEIVRMEEAGVPLGYLGDPEDIANLVAFLASDKGRYISGTTIAVDGGATLSVF